VFIVKPTAIYSLVHRLHTHIVLPRSTQNYNLHWMVKWISTFWLNYNNKMTMVGVDDSIRKLDLRPKSVG